MITVRDVFPDFEEFDVFIAEESVRKIYSLTNPSTLWATWPGKETDVYFWVTTDDKNVGVNRNGEFVVCL
jgi:hypothetical protein